MLTLGCPIIEILVEIAVFTGYKGDYPDFSVQGSEKQQITYQLYIALAVADFLLIIFSILLLYGNERSDEIRSRKFLLPWAILLPFFIVYESAVNIYYFYHQFNDKYIDPLSDGHSKGYEIVPLVYWIVKDILYFISFMFVIMRIQSLTPIIEYVREEEGCGCSAPAPVVSLPTPVTFNTGGCSSGACGRASAGCGCGKAPPQPIYGYRSGVSSAGAVGYSTNIYNHHR